MKIVRLQAENVKKLRCVEINPDGGLTVIGGKNGSGKSSLLDSIMMAFAGKQAIPSKPVRKGAEKASITIELDEDFVIRRIIKPDGETSIEVRTKAGAKYPSPQALLDGFSAKFTFDPLRFKLMDAKEQAGILKRILGLDFSQVDADRKALYDKRTDANRIVRDLEGQLAGRPLHENIPSEEISVSDLADEIARAGRLEQERSSLERDVSAAESDCLDCDSRLAEIEKDIADLQRESELLAVARRKRCEEILILRSGISGIVVPDVADLRKQVSAAELTNRKVRENRDRLSLAARVDQKRAESENLTSGINGLDAEKTAQIQAAKFPVAGLSVEDGYVTLGGIPFDQLSAAEQLRISVAIGIALNPKLKVLLIRDGSLLDEDNLRLVAELAAEHDAQVLIERVGHGQEVSVVLEDGSVKVAEEPVLA